MRPTAIPSVGGMVVSVLVTIFITPCLFSAVKSGDGNEPTEMQSMKAYQETPIRTIPMFESFTASLRAASFGLSLAVLTLLFGQGIGIVFGLNEDAIKSRLASSAAEVRETVYQGNDAAIKAVLDKSWVYMQRAHLHAGGMGTTAFALGGFICLLGAPRRVTAAICLALGAGGLGYSVFWMWAGFRAPALGGTGTAKESLKWLAMPSSGLFVLATVAVLVLLLVTMVRRRQLDPRP